MSQTIVRTTTTTSTSGSRTLDGGGFLNTAYCRTNSGILQLAQVVVLLIAFLCITCAPYWIDVSASRFFEVVTLWFLFTFLIFFLMHVLRLQSKITCINWTLTEFLNYLIGTILVLIASIVMATKSYNLSALVAASVFGFIATFLLAISLWTTYRVTCSSQPTGAAV